MTHGDAHRLEPYRIEWRANLTTRWVRITSVETHDKALMALAETHVRWEGQVRIVSQHVIEAKGLGA